MKTKIYLLHGFNVSDGGKGSIGVLKPYLEAVGYDVRLVDYGYMLRLRVRLCNDNIAKMLATTIEPGSILIGHSNGCVIIHKATYYGAPTAKVIYINPVLDGDLAPNKQVKDFTVFYSPNDKATSLASWVPWSDWGDMGTTGFVGFDDRAANINEEDLTGEEMRHSSFAKWPNLFGGVIARICEL